MPSPIIHDAMTHPLVLLYAPDRNNIDTPNAITMWTVVDGEVVQIGEDIVPGPYLEWTRDCTQYAFTGFYRSDTMPIGRIWMNFPGRRHPNLITPQDSTAFAYGGFWSPDGTTLAYITRGRRPNVYAANVATGDTRPIDTNEGLGVGTSGWLNSRQLIIGQRNSRGVGAGSLFIATFDGYGFQFTPIPGNFQVVLPDPADHDRFAGAVFADDDQRSLNLYDTNGELIRPLVSDADLLGSWSPDGRWIIYGDGQRNWYVIDVETGEQHLTAPAPAIYLVPQWSNDSTRFIYSFVELRDDILNRGIATYNLETGVTETLITIDPTDPGYYDFRVCIP